MKIKLTCEVDSGVLVKFLNTLEQREENFTPDSFIEEKMKEYIDSPENYSEEFPKIEDTLDDKFYEDLPSSKIDSSDETDLVKLLMEKTKNYKVGQLAGIVLRKLLELGVATPAEIQEMQKASGPVQVKNYHTKFGHYCHDNFNTSFPVLITDYQKKIYDDESLKKFLVQPLAIGKQKFHLSAQWYVFNLNPMKTWIVNHLRKWLDQADEQQKDELKRFINGL